MKMVGWRFLATAWYTPPPPAQVPVGDPVAQAPAPEPGAAGEKEDTDSEAPEEEEEADSGEDSDVDGVDEALDEIIEIPRTSGRRSAPVVRATVACPL